MGNGPKNPQNADVFGMSFMNPYMNLFNIWQKNWEAFSQVMNPQYSAQRDLEGRSGGATEMFRHVTEQQPELFRFFGRRWEQYIEFLTELSRCRSPMEAAQLQTAYLSKMMSDFSTEGRRFAELFPEFFSNAMPGRAVSPPQDQRYHH